MQVTLIITAVIILGVLLLLTKASYSTFNILNLIKTNIEKNNLSDADKIANSRNFIYAGIIACFLSLLFIVWLWLKDSIYEGHFHEWMNIIVRWMHITFGIAWIGTSFLFCIYGKQLTSQQKKARIKRRPLDVARRRVLFCGKI